MNDFYKQLIGKTEVQKEKDQEKTKGKNELLVKEERTIPKLKIKFSRRANHKWKQDG